MPGVCGYNPQLLSLQLPRALERVSPRRNTQQIYRQLPQAGIPRIIYIHHLNFVALIPPAQHKTRRFMTGLTLLLMSWSLQSELPPVSWHREELWVKNCHLQRRDKWILKLWIIPLCISITVVYREPCKPGQLQDRTNVLQLLWVFWQKPLNAPLWRGGTRRCRSLTHPVTQLCLIPRVDGASSPSGAQCSDTFHHFWGSAMPKALTNQLPNNDFFFFIFS